MGREAGPRSMAALYPAISVFGKTVISETTKAERYRETKLILDPPLIEHCRLFSLAMLSQAFCFTVWFTGLPILPVIYYV